MNGQVFMSLVLCTFVVSIGFGGSDRVPKKYITDEGTVVSLSIRSGGDFVVEGGLDWVLVDSMNNAYSMLSNVVDPLAFDPNSGVAAIIHRANGGYGLGVWYNVTTDGGATWIRISELCMGLVLSSTPNATISHPTGASSGVLWWASTELTPGPFDYLIYGFDILGVGVPYCVEDSFVKDPWSNNRIAAADDNWCVWWLTRNVGSFYLWSYCAGLDQSEPWPAGDFSALGQDAGLAYRNGTLYFGVFATFPGDPGIVFNVAYSASTDSGTTWSAWNGPNIGSGDWRTLPGIAGTVYTDWHDKNSFDMVVDANGYVHFFGILVDDYAMPSMLAVAEIYETGSGWAANIIAEGLSSTTRTDYNGVDQMGYHVNSAISADGMAMAVNWLSAPAEGDTLPDIYGSVRHINSASWSAAENYTNTPDFAELLVQVAPTLRSDGNDNYTLFLARAYQCGEPPPPYPPNDLTCTNIFVGTKNLNIPLTEVDEELGVPAGYHLAQNYPNPFNPKTEIGFQIMDYGLVLLTVYDLLGREIETLVNEELAPGTYRRQWDASGYPSGVYFYQLSTTNFVQTKRLVLLR